MLPKVSLMEELKKGGYEASLITTYNSYLPFYEDVVLRRLFNAGVRHNVLMMDARQYAASLAHQPPRHAGRQYTLLPVSVSGAFHPKLIFLAGKSKGAVFIGSHNMTLAGFGYNREMTNAVRIEGAADHSGLYLAQEVWEEVEHWLAHFTPGIPGHVREMARRVANFAPWLKGEARPDPNTKLLKGRPGHASLWQQLSDAVPGSGGAEIAISGAFFDQNLSFVKRVQSDLQPRRVTVAIDPGTVQIPAHARNVAGVSFVNACSLAGGKDSKENGGGSYLHAKSLLLRQADGRVALASGSANPSSPAWLASEGAGNVELMLLRLGEDVAAAAGELGLAALHELPVLDETDWETISQTPLPDEAGPPSGVRNGVALAEEARLLFDAALLNGLGKPVFVLVSADGAELAQTGLCSIEDDCAVVAFAPDEIAKAARLTTAGSAGETTLNLWLHHARLIEEQARTGTQRKFKEALLSLDTDTPDIGLLIQCIDKIIFDEKTASEPAKLRQPGARKPGEGEEAPAPETLAIDVSELKKRGSKRRLNHSSDFAYLLDALIYHLQIREDRSLEERDKYGRNEEEQIGSDDDASDPVQQMTTAEQASLLSACHAKVGTLVRRMVLQLEAYSENRLSLQEVLVRLLGVLAVFRELRRCDGRVTWVEKGRTTVPEEQRMRLLHGIMFNLFERNPASGDASLLNLKPLGDEFQESDDLARLKGLVLWLAWDCGLTLDLRRSHADRQASELRLKQNAMVLALAQMVRAEEVVIDEARQSIGSMTSSELAWLKEIEQLAAKCESLRTARPETVNGPANPGDIAVHLTVEDWDFRLVAGYDGKNVRLVRLHQKNDRAPFRASHICAVPFGVRQ